MTRDRASSAWITLAADVVEAELAGSVQRDEQAAPEPEQAQGQSWPADTAVTLHS